MKEFRSMLETEEEFVFTLKEIADIIRAAKIPTTVMCRNAALLNTIRRIKKDGNKIPYISYSKEK